MAAANETIDTVREVTEQGYKWGFVTDIDMETAPKGLSEDTVRFISAKKEEPEWMLEWRLRAFEAWKSMEEPHHWGKISYPPIDYQDAYYYAAPKMKERPKTLADVDPELLRTYEKLGIPLREQEILAGVETSNIAVDAVFDSVSVATTFRKKLEEMGVIFCSISEAIKEHPELVRKYMGSVVPYTDNYFATLNSAVFTDGSFVYIPKGVRCPMELSTYFRINAANTGQFERTLIIADEGSHVSYLEGCTAPKRDENQLHAAVVELVALDDATIKYSTVQNWYPGDAEGRGGIYNFVTKRAACRGRNSKVSWTQVETGSAITWKYPSCILQGDNSVGEFYSVAITNNFQQADTGTKMIHIGKNTRSTIVSKGISAGKSNNTYRGLVKILPKAQGARNHTQCDSLLIGDQCGAHTVPYIENRNRTASVEHEATTAKISEDQLFYCRSRGISEEDAVNLIVNGFVKQVLQELPMEFAVEAQKLVAISLEGSVG
ncbi:MAG TPA: Fe-S cluster assembly protein SufB [Azospirillaceae bacterium]|nr:Fe-S cluster assembly protein SufB [Azospirillaceae bacterium]